LTRQLLLFAFVSVFVGSCTRESPPAPGAGPIPPPMSSAITTAATLDHLDKRAPVPLLPMMANHQKENMRDHLLAVQEIVAALATEDYPSIERAVSRIGFSEQMGQMCTHMGAGAAGFTERALDFHHTADRIGTAARDRDRTRVLSELGATLQTCTSCHAAWKQQVVDDPTWQTLTSTAPPSHVAPH
jgi:hypothetical protein